MKSDNLPSKTQYYRAVALDMVNKERDRQNKLKAQGRFVHTPFDVLMAEPEKLATILEELGEVARNTLRRGHLVTDGDSRDEALLTELSQVAALTLAWMERLIANREAGDPVQIVSEAEVERFDKALGEGRN
jgi:hypothetical protein